MTAPHREPAVTLPVEVSKDGVTIRSDGGRSESQTLQSGTDMEESLSQYFGRPTESTSVQANMQRQHSLAPIGPNEIAKCL